jgi:HAD superfamily hydrolase (TIGR01509 family)
LAEWGILDLFDEVFCSAVEGLVKPDEAAYILMLKRLGVLPSEAIFIDDTAGHVEAAQKLGIHAILFTDAAELQNKLNHLIAF